MKRKHNEKFEDYVVRRKERNDEISLHLKGKIIEGTETTFRTPKGRIKVHKSDLMSKFADAKRDKKVERSKKNKASYKSKRVNRLRDK